MQTIKNKILVTGAAGFIGYHLVQNLSKNSSNEIYGIDNINDYYDEKLKLARVENNSKLSNYTFEKMDINDRDNLFKLFEEQSFDIVINLAAQAGVRYSLENPYAYAETNIGGFLNILEACRNNKIKHLLYASSSSVYGGNQHVPFSENDNVDHPVSLYAATKKSNELMAHTYSHLYGIPTTGLRFFTVYGPYGRPDMAYFSFTKNILENKSIRLFNQGNMSRDFTYIDDIVEGVTRLISVPPSGNPNWSRNENPSESWAPYEVYNIGNSDPVSLLDFVQTIEKHVGIEAEKVYVDMQSGDVEKTFADVSKIEKAINFKPSTSLDSGIGKFVEWYREYYGV